MSANDLLGQRGEVIVEARLLDFCGNPLPYFQPHYLGAKCPTFDYLVEVLGVGPSPPYFFAQVKATQRGPTTGSVQLRVGVKAADVGRMVRCPVPTYLIGVDEPRARAYIVSIHGGLTKGIASMPTRYPLDRTNLKRLRDEVQSYWMSLDPSIKASAFTF